jgi:hypothetical protein
MSINDIKDGDDGIRANTYGGHAAGCGKVRARELQLQITLPLSRATLAGARG